MENKTIKSKSFKAQEVQRGVWLIFDRISNENAGYYRVLKGFGGLWDTYYNVDRLQELTDLCRKCETEFTLLTEKETKCTSTPDEN